MKFFFSTIDIQIKWKFIFSTIVQWCNVNDFFYLVGYNFILAFIYLFINSSYQHQCPKVKIHQTHLVSKPTSKENTMIRLRIVDDCFFSVIWHYFISNSHQPIINFGRIFFKAQKSLYLHKTTSRPIVKNQWRYYLVKTYGSSLWYIILFSAHDPNSWVSSEKLWKSWFGGSRWILSKTPMIQS